MRHPSGEPPFLSRIKTLDERDLVRPLRILEIPSVVWVRFDRVRLALASRVDQPHADQVRVRNRVAVGDGEGVLIDCLDWAPDLC